MVTIARARVSPVLLLLVAIMLLYPSTARAARVDIDDPSLLGSVVRRVDVTHGGANGLEHLISEVRYDAGTYSYIYAVQTSPYFPSGFGLSEGSPELVSVAVTGHTFWSPETFGAIYGSDSIWGGCCSAPTNTVESITLIPGGFLAVARTTEHRRYVHRGLLTGFAIWIPPGGDSDLHRSKLLFFRAVLF